jgi:hypothetical protein
MDVLGLQYQRLSGRRSTQKHLNTNLQQYHSENHHEKYSYMRVYAFNRKEEIDRIIFVFFPSQALKSTVMVTLQSQSPKAHGALFLRKDEVPFIDSRFENTFIHLNIIPF